MQKLVVQVLGIKKRKVWKLFGPIVNCRGIRDEVQEHTVAVGVPGVCSHATTHNTGEQTAIETINQHAEGKMTRDTQTHTSAYPRLARRQGPGHTGMRRYHALVVPGTPVTTLYFRR
jgi:hypothetical protein